MQREIIKILKFPLALLLLLLVIISVPRITGFLKNRSESAALLPLKALNCLKSNFPVSFGGSLRKENRLLKEKVAALQVTLAEREEVARESERLRKLLEFKKTSPFRSIPAEVIGRDASNWTDVVIIDRGRDDGITRHMAVTTCNGLVGSVAEVNAKTSRVRLVTDPGSRVAVRLEKNRQDGILQGTWTGLCKMIYIPEDADVEIGEEVITSDYSEFFRPGIPVGKVLKVGREKGMMYKYAIVKPYQDPSSLEEVLCIE